MSMSKNRIKRHEEWEYVNSYIITVLIGLTIMFAIVFSGDRITTSEIQTAKEYSFKLYNEGLKKFCDYTTIEHMELEFTNNDDLDKFYNEGLKFVNHTDLDKFELDGGLMWDKIYFENDSLNFYDHGPTYITVKTHLYYEGEISSYVYDEKVNLKFFIWPTIAVLFLSSLFWYTVVYTVIKNKYDKIWDMYYSYLEA